MFVPIAGGNDVAEQRTQLLTCDGHRSRRGKLLYTNAGRCANQPGGGAKQCRSGCSAVSTWCQAVPIWAECGVQVGHISAKQCIEQQ